MENEKSFWSAIGAIGLAVSAFFKYKTAKAQQRKGSDMEAQNETNQHYGIKETQDVIIGLGAIGEEIISVTKDGLQIPKDAIQIAEDIIAKPEFKQKLADMIGNIKDVPNEIKDLDIVEGGQLAATGFQVGKQIADALKK